MFVEEGRARLICWRRNGKKIVWGYGLIWYGNWIFWFLIPDIYGWCEKKDRSKKVVTGLLLVLEQRCMNWMLGRCRFWTIITNTTCFVWLLPKWSKNTDQRNRQWLIDWLILLLYPPTCGTLTRSFQSGRLFVFCLIIFFLFFVYYSFGHELTHNTTRRRLQPAGVQWTT